MFQKQTGRTSSKVKRLVSITQIHHNIDVNVLFARFNVNLAAILWQTKLKRKYGLLIIVVHHFQEISFVNIKKNLGRKYLNLEL